MSDLHTTYHEGLSHGSQPNDMRMMSAPEQRPVSQPSSLIRHSSPTPPPVDRHKHRSRHRNSVDSHDTHTRPHNTNHPHISTRYLLRRLLDVEEQAANLRRILSTALARADSETRRAEEAERRTLDALQQAREARTTAETATDDAKRAREDLSQCRSQLEVARREAVHAAVAQRETDLRKREADRLAGRARDAVRRLEEERFMHTVRAEGRRQGFEQGFVRGQQIAFDPRRVQGPINESEVQTHMHEPDAFDNKPASVDKRLDWPPNPVADESVISRRYLDEAGNLAEIAESVRNVDVDDNVDRPTNRTSPVVIKSRFIEQMSEPPDLFDNPPSPPNPESELEHDSQTDIDPLPLSAMSTPPIQVYAISIPPQDELEGPPSPPNSPAQVPTTGDSDPTNNGSTRRTRSGRFVHYLTAAAKPRRWSSVKSSVSTATTRSNPPAQQTGTNTGLGLVNETDVLNAEEVEVQTERLDEHPASLIPSTSEVREILGGMIKPFRSISLRRKKTDNEQTMPLDYNADTRNAAQWQYEDARDTHHKNSSDKHPVLAFTKRALRRGHRMSLESPIPNITIIPPSQSSSTISSGSVIEEPDIPEDADYHTTAFPDNSMHPPHSPPTPDTPALDTPSQPFAPPPPHIAQDGWLPPEFVSANSDVKSPPRGRFPSRRPRGAWWAWDSSGSGSEEGVI